MSEAPAATTHGRQRFTGRDPDEEERASTPLELLYDLTIVVAFGTAADELAHFIAMGHIGLAFLAYVPATFAVAWAWQGYSWFASAYDTEDWVFRLATMAQMLGVIVLALGLPPFFETIAAKEAPDNTVMVAGYVVMRVPLLFLWWQVSRHDPDRADTARLYLITVTLAQIGWVGVAIAHLALIPSLIAFGVFVLIEMAGPVLAETRGAGTPWHPRHIAERYNLLVIITLGEVVLGTVFAVNAVVHGEAGWTVQAALLMVAGVGLTFGSWWVYFSIPWAEPLVRHRDRGFIVGYGHLAMFGAIAAMGAGLHVAAYTLEGEAKVGTTAVVAIVAGSFALFAALYFWMATYLLRSWHSFHALLLIAMAAILILAVVLAAAGVSMTVCLLVLAITPIVSVVGYERLGWRHVDDALKAL